jgi:glycosyltransferase involved in cell wall biosynthesis
VVWDGLRTDLPTPIAPGMRVTVEMRVDSPPAPGEYQLVPDLVEEGVTWFSHQQVPPLVLPLTYQLCSGPRATVVNGNCVRYDAIGNHLVAELEALRQAGYEPLLLVEHLDARLPLDVRRAAVSLRLADVRAPAPEVRWAVEHFLLSDVVIVTFSTSYELCELITLARGTVVFDYHGVTPPELWGAENPGYRNQVQGQRSRNLVRYADYAMARSRYMRDELLQTGLIPAERVVVTPLGQLPLPPKSTPLLWQTPSRDQEAPCVSPLLPDAGREGPPQRVLLYVGRMARNKRLIDLVEALALVRQHHPETCLLLVGDNQLRPYRDYAREVQQRARDLGCEAGVCFTGQVPDLEPYYRRCDLFVTASIHEGFCLPVIEAMAHGKPVVAVAATALPETIGEGGVLCEPRNPASLAAAIVRLLNDLDLPMATSLPADGRDRGQEKSKQAHFPAACLHLGEGERAEAEARLRDRTIAFVALRYGDGVVGGAERLIRGWAEHLAAEGYRVEVLTTCIRDLSSWANQHAPGVEQVNGLTVRRFAIDDGDAGVFHRIQARAIRGEPVSYRDELAFLDHNLTSRGLNHYLRDHADTLACAIFAPYLFGTTCQGMRVLPDKAIVAPCLHDEPVARFQVFREMLEAAGGLFFNTRAESDFATAVLHVQNPYRTIVGYGFDCEAAPADGSRFRRRSSLPTFLLYSGRLEEAKNVPLLIEYFVRYKREFPGLLALVLTGTGTMHPPIPERPDIVPLGIVPEAEMPHIFASALALCQPSLNESFSIVMMEAWLQGRPVLVHARCAVTSEHVRGSGGGMTFHDYPTFRAALQRLVQDPARAAEMGQRGRAYVGRHYRWRAVVDRLVSGIVAFTAPRSEYCRLAQRGIQRSLAFTPARFSDGFTRAIAQASALTGRSLSGSQQQQLDHLARLVQGDCPSPSVPSASRAPSFLGRLAGWLCRQHPDRLAPFLAHQEHLNRALVQSLIPALEQSHSTQRRLQREVALLRERLEQHPDEACQGEDCQREHQE